MHFLLLIQPYYPLNEHKQEFKFDSLKNPAEFLKDAQHYSTLISMEFETDSMTQRPPINFPTEKHRHLR
jgi:hypothetical protein